MKIITGVSIDKNFEPSPDYFGEFVVVIGLEEIVRYKTLAEAEACASLFTGIQIRDLSVGRAGYSMYDFVEDVKCTCAREGVQFDNAGFNELVG